MAGKRAESQYPKSTPGRLDALLSWIRNTAKLWTRGSGGRWAGHGGRLGRRGSGREPLRPHPLHWGRSSSQEQASRSGPRLTIVVSHTVGVYEELEGLGRSLLDSPKSHRHAGGTQDYEGLTQAPGETGWDKAGGGKERWQPFCQSLSTDRTPRPTGQWPQVGHCNVPA